MDPKADSAKLRLYSTGSSNGDDDFLNTSLEIRRIIEAENSDPGSDSDCPISFSAQGGEEEDDEDECSLSGSATPVAFQIQTPPESPTPIADYEVALSHKPSRLGRMSSRPVSRGLLKLQAEEGRMSLSTESLESLEEIPSGEENVDSESPSALRSDTDHSWNVPGGVERLRSAARQSLTRSASFQDSVLSLQSRHHGHRVKRKPKPLNLLSKQSAFDESSSVPQASRSPEASPKEISKSAIGTKPVAKKGLSRSVSIDTGLCLWNMNSVLLLKLRGLRTRKTAPGVLSV